MLLPFGDLHLFWYRKMSVFYSLQLRISVWSFFLFYKSISEFINQSIDQFLYNWKQLCFKPIASKSHLCILRKWKVTNPQITQAIKKKLSRFSHDLSSPQMWWFCCCYRHKMIIRKQNVNIQVSNYSCNIISKYHMDAACFFLFFYFLL